MTNAIVFGGTGYVGSHVVRRLLEASATVVVPSRSPTGLATLADSCGADRERLVGVLADLSDPAGAARVAEVVTSIGAFDLAVAAIGGWWEGTTLLDLDLGTWDVLVANHLTAHFVAARMALPHLRGPGSALVTLNGIAALQPEVGSGPISITGVAQKMMLDVFRAEAGPDGVRMHELCVVNPIVDDGQAEQAGEAVVEIGRVVDAVLELARDGDPSSDRTVLGEA